uniref:Odorant receptor n=1 Tax=Locusta migratoria TaxID=7004 RepID=A0A0M4JMH3_LOCMI|nr:odorant receptor 44 [Locusta migratoria]
MSRAYIAHVGNSLTESFSPKLLRKRTVLFFLSLRSRGRALEMPEQKVQLQRGARICDVLRHNVLLLVATGAWPPTTRRWWRPLYPLYTASIYFSMLATIAMGFQFAYQSWGDWDSIMLTFVNTFTLIGGAVKLAHFSSHVDAYRRLVTALRDVIGTQWAHCERDAALMAAFAGSHRKALWLTWAPVVYLNILGPVWFMMPVVAWASGAPGRQFPFANVRGVLKTNFPLYVAVYFVQCHSVFYWNFLSFGLDIFFVTCMIYVSAQLHILGKRLSNVGRGPNVDQNGIVDEKQTKLQQFGQKPYKSLEVDRESNEMYAELVDCVKAHQHILSFVAVLQGVMSPVAMAQFVCSATAACITPFQATFNPEGNSIFKCLMYLPMPAFQIYIYCWGGHEIIDEGAALSASAYSCAWMGAPRRVTSAMHVLMCRAQKPLTLTAGKLYPVNRDTFVSLINGSYSFYALLRQMRGH